MTTQRAKSNRSFKRSMTLFIYLIAMIGLVGGESPAPAQQKASPRLIERVSFDWTHSGTTSTFSIVRRDKLDGYKSDRLLIETRGEKRWSFSSEDGGWATISAVGLSHLRKQNLVRTSKHFLFVSSGSPGANIYLILKGVDFGCCVGSLTVLTPGANGRPTVVFQESGHLLAAITPTQNGSVLELIGQSSDSEARAIKNAESYDPYRVYLLQQAHPAQYDLSLSKAYTLKHYCEWHGPKYDERYIAVGLPIGAAHCRVMTEAAFALYRQQHTELFPEP